MFKSMANINIVHVPYKGAAPALTDLLSGQVQVAFYPAAVVQQHVKSGRLRALAVTGLKRTRLMPELPTVAEAALPGFEASGWYGLLAPTGVPGAIVARLHREMMTALSARDLQERFLVLGVDTIGAGPAEFAQYIRAELAKWGKVVRDSGARTD
jgi:tripartite-type tricarboxylate transporter receptor subunit TctC